MNEQEILSDSPDETWRIAGEFIDSLSLPAVVALHGDLGSGKTCFVQGMAMALGVDQPVTSPTFKIINEYSGRSPLYHIDLYRLEKASEAFSIGIEDYIEGDGITAIEWAERAEDLLPYDTIHIDFSVMPEPDTRKINIKKP